MIDVERVEGIIEESCYAYGNGFDSCDSVHALNADTVEWRVTQHAIIDDCEYNLEARGICRLDKYGFARFEMFDFDPSEELFMLFPMNELRFPDKDLEHDFKKVQRAREEFCEMLNRS